jgi:hypothetical protein
LLGGPKKKNERNLTEKAKKMKETLREGEKKSDESQGESIGEKPCKAR